MHWTEALRESIDGEIVAIDGKTLRRSFAQAASRGAIHTRSEMGVRSCARMHAWAHGHQRKAIRDFVRALSAQQTGCQAQLVRSFGNQEAATKRLSRLLHNERLEPRHLAEAVLLQALLQLPPYSPVRLAIDWTIDGHQYLLVVSLIVGRRVVPIYRRAYAATVLKGRMRGKTGVRSGRYER
jgi:hypothetical protein